MAGSFVNNPPYRCGEGVNYPSRTLGCIPSTTTRHSSSILQAAAIPLLKLCFQRDRARSIPTIIMPVHFKNKSTDTFRVQYQYAIRLPEQGGGTLGIVLPGVTGGATVRNQYTWYPAEFNTPTAASWKRCGVPRSLLQN